MRLDMEVLFDGCIYPTLHPTLYPSEALFFSKWKYRRMFGMMAAFASFFCEREKICGGGALCSERESFETFSFDASVRCTRHPGSEVIGVSVKLKVYDE